MESFVTGHQILVSNNFLNLWGSFNCCDEAHKILPSPVWYIYRPQTKFAKVMFLWVSVWPHGGGHAWLLRGVCKVAPGGACMVAPGGACVVALGGVHGCSGGCVVALGGVHGFFRGHAWLLREACMVVPGGCAWLLGGHVWLLRGGMHGCSWGACMVAPGGMCMVAPGGHAWLLWGCVCGFFGGACMVFLGGVCMVAPREHVWFFRGVCIGYNEIGQLVGGTHPTWMHSCYLILFAFSRSDCNRNVIA